MNIKNKMKQQRSHKIKIFLCPPSYPLKLIPHFICCFKDELWLR